jgi:hypothetical protein
MAASLIKTCIFLSSGGQAPNPNPPSPRPILYRPSPRSVDKTLDIDTPAITVYPKLKFLGNCLYRIREEETMHLVADFLSRPF